MKKRILSLLLAVVTVMGMMVTPSVAASDDYKSWSQSDKGSEWYDRSIASDKSSGHIGQDKNGNDKWMSHLMQNVGCYVTAVAKLLVHAGQKDPGSYDPGKCLDDLLAHGMLSNLGGMYTTSFNRSNFLKDCAPELAYESSPGPHDAWSKSTAAANLGDRINKNYYAIVCVTNKTTQNDHWMAVDRVENGEVYVMDNGGVVPLYGTEKYSGGITDQVYFKYSGSKSYPASGCISTNSSSGTSNGSLRRGDNNESVREMQKMLNVVANAKLDEDGDFGAVTETRLKSYQTSRGLTADGVCGPVTWAQLTADYDAIVNAPPTLRRGDNSEWVKKMQKLLNVVANAKLDEDGDFGAVTEARLKSYQASRGLTADGICGPVTWAALNSDREKILGSTPPLAPRSDGINPEASGVAYPSTQTVTVDNRAVEFEMYALSNEYGQITNYVKLRDLAYILNGTAAQFSVGYADGRITLTRGDRYAANGSEMLTPYAGDQDYQKRTGVTTVDVWDVDLQAFTLQNGSYTYYKLRDLGQALGFNVGWSSGRGVFIETDKAYDYDD